MKEISREKKVRGDVKRAEVICVEAFQKSRREEILDKLSKLTQAKPKESTYTEAGDRGRLLTWRFANLEELFQTLLRDVESEKWGGTAEVFRTFVAEVEIEAIDTLVLPFLIVVLRVGVKTDAVAVSEDPRKDLRGVYNPFRLWLEKLDGLSGAGATASPRVPVIIYLGISTPPGTVPALHSTAKEIRELGSPTPEAIELSRRHREMEPVDLGDELGDLRSHFILSGNASMIIGHTYQLGMFGIRTPYVVVLAEDGNLFGPDIPRFPTMPFIPTEPTNVLWWGPHFLIVPLALHVWLNSLSTEMHDLDKSLAGSRSAHMKGRKHLEADSSLDSLTSAGSRVASIEVDVDLTERRYGPILRSWSEGRYSDSREITIFPTKWGGSILLSRGYKEGYLSTMARELVQGFDSVSSTLGRIERVTELLLRYGSEAVMRRATVAMELSARTTTRLTWVLVSLTVLLAILTFVLVFR